MFALYYLPIHVIISLSSILDCRFASINFTDDLIELTPMTTYQEAVIVKKYCVINPAGNI